MDSGNHQIITIEADACGCSSRIPWNHCVIRHFYNVFFFLNGFIKKKRSMKSLIAILVLNLVALFLLADKPKPSLEKYLWSTGCEGAWSSMLRNLNRSVDPCENFYEFACGNFEPDYGTVLLGNMASVDLHQMLKISHILEEPEDVNDNGGYQEAQRFYASCVTEKMSTSEVESNKDGTSFAIRVTCADEARRRNMTTIIAEVFAQSYMKPNLQEAVKLEMLGLFQHIREVLLRIHSDSVWGDIITGYRGMMAAETVRICIENVNSSRTWSAFMNKQSKPELYTKELFNEESHTNDEKNYEVPVICFGADGEIHFDNILRIATLGVNGYCIPGKNYIVLSLGMLASELFTPDRPGFLRFATTGSIIGHEIGHGVDWVNIFDNSYGKPMWWIPEIGNEFGQSRRCLADRFAGYNEPGNESVKIDGYKTLLENVADLAGFKAAYIAYHEWLKTNREQKQKMPGLETFTNKQLFWISAATLKCGYQYGLGLSRKVVNGRHAPDEIRVLGTFSNIEEFGKDFNCPLGSPMNPVKKCHVW